MAALDTPEIANDPGRAPGAYVMRAQHAHVLFRLNQRRQALAQVSAAVEGLERLASQDAGGRLAAARLLLGRMLTETGRPADAEPTLAAALAWIRAPWSHPPAVCGSRLRARAGAPASATP